MELLLYGLMITPIASCASISGERPLSSRSSTSLVVIAWPTDGILGFTSGHIRSDLHRLRRVADRQLNVDHRVVARADVGALRT